KTCDQRHARTFSGSQSGRERLKSPDLSRTEQISLHQRSIVTGNRVLNLVSRGRTTTSCSISTAPFFHFFWLLRLLHQPQSWPSLNRKTPVSRSESTT